MDVVHADLLGPLRERMERNTGRSKLVEEVNKTAQHKVFQVAKPMNLCGCAAPVESQMQGSRCVPERFSLNYASGRQVLMFQLEYRPPPFVFVRLPSPSDRGFMLQAMLNKATSGTIHNLECSCLRPWRLLARVPTPFAEDVVRKTCLSHESTTILTACR
jgi:hypothetical protein